MSCQLNVLAHIQDVRAVKKYLFPDQNEETEKEADDFQGWDDNDWGWKDENKISENKESVLLSWLQDCHISLSPAGDLLVLANDTRVVHLAQKWDSRDEDIQIKYNVIFEGGLSQEPGEKITCVFCLPLASQKRSTHGGPDWTCVIVGFSTGYIRIFTENGTLLISQIFSEECILQIKCNTYATARHQADGETHEEISILYSRSLVTIDGFSFFQSLKACKNQVARAAASGSELFQPPPLAYKKWALLEQEQPSSFTPCGIQNPNAFDQMKVDSLTYGCHATVRASLIASHLYLTTGVGPYVSYFYTIQGGTQPLLSDVAHAVASKLKSAFLSAASGWLGLSGSKTGQDAKDRKRPKIEPATGLPARFGLYDKRRSGESVVLAPDGRMAVTTDSFGRVILLDVLRGVAIRMWKGYRDAQVGWVESKEDIFDEVAACNRLPRHAIFLVIYAPRRGILEVWATEYGPRVAAFSVSKWCRLLCPGYGIMGLNNATYRDVKVNLNNIYLIDLDGTVKTVDVPFHLSLGDKNSKRARDLHLLKQLKISLKEKGGDCVSFQNEIIATLLDIKTHSIRQQGLERLIKTKYITAEVLQNVITAVAQQMDELFAEQGEAGMECNDFESRTLIQFCKFHQLLVTVYMMLSSSFAASGLEEIMDSMSTDEILQRVLSLNTDDASSISSLIDKYHSIVAGSEGHVKAKVELTMSVVEFIGCFECRVLKSDCETFQQGSSFMASLLPNLSELKTSKLATFIYKRALCSKETTEYKRILKETCIPAENLMSLLLHIWLSEDVQPQSHIQSLHALLAAVVSPAENAIWLTEEAESFWNNFIEICSQSENVCSTLIMALVGKDISCTDTVQANNEDVDLNGHCNEMSDWESVTIEKERWMMLVKQLEDLLVVQCLLKMKLPLENIVKPIGEPDAVTICLKRVLDGGKGVIPELIAKWISGHGIPPHLLCPPEDETLTVIHDQQTKCSAQINKRISLIKAKSTSFSCSNLVAQLHEVQQHLPHTLNSDTLMANCSWEFMVIWNRDPEVVYPLEQAIAYLKCVHNAVLQHGLAMMIWQMFAVKRISATAILTEKVGKAPKDRLCRKDVGLSETSLEKFVFHAIVLLDIIAQASQESQEMPAQNIEDLWQNVQGPTSLIELALEQKEANRDLVDHHYCLCIILHAILVFGMKSVKPLSLYETKGKNAFFKPLHSLPLLSYRVSDDVIIACRRQFLSRVISHAVLALGESPALASISSISSMSPTSSASFMQLRSSTYSKWPPLMMKLAQSFGLDDDVLIRHHVMELYNSGFDKMAEEVLLTVTDHVTMGSELLILAGARIAHFVFNVEPHRKLEKLANCTPSMGSWLKTMEPSSLRYPDPALKMTAGLLGNVINQLAEGQPEYKLAVELITFLHYLS